MSSSTDTPQDYGHPGDASEEAKPAHPEKIPKLAQRADVAPDSLSDPALSVGQGSDWTDEGGATPNGPATAESSADSKSSDERKE